jgi:trimethylamine--corrinoid protein Co-methyltransferase
MQLPRLEILSDGDISKIHEASLRVLSETGIVVGSEKALKLLAQAGARVDFQKRLVKIPPRLVEETLISLPSEITLYNTRSKQPAFTLDGASSHMVAGSDALFFLDFETGEHRLITRKDVTQFTRIADALENIDMVGCAGMPQDVPRKASALYGAQTVFNNTEKPLVFPHEAPEVTRAVFEIARVASGEDDLSKHPILICLLSPTSPLSWTPGAADALIETAKCGVPCIVLPQPYSGVTAPLTLAGLLTVNNAEFLSSVVISQLVNKGTPMIYGQAWTTFDMRTATVLMASPESSLSKIAGKQLAKFYQIPAFSTGLNSDAPCLDIQDGWENAISGFAVLYSAMDLIADFGLTNACLIASNEQLVIDSEILGILRRIERGIDVSPKTIAVDVINKVGPKGNYLTEEHTLRYLRTEEHWESIISNRLNYETWTKKGSPDAKKNAKERAKQILKTHTSKSLDEDKQKEITLILNKFESEEK